MTEQPLTADLALALDLADAADELSLSRFRAADLVVDTKPDLTPVSEADRAVERALRAELVRLRPDDAILGEEYGSAGEARRRWIIDPIDGTKNYVRGVPVWATLIALLIDEDDRARRGVGACAGPPLVGDAGRRRLRHRPDRARAPTAAGQRVSPALRMRPSRTPMLSAGTSADPRAGLTALLHGTWRQRAYGDFWSHLMVAEGVVDIAAEPQLESYDMAALVPIVEEAGGRLTAYDGGSAIAGGSAVSTNGLLHEEVLACYFVP